MKKILLNWDGEFKKEYGNKKNKFTFSQKQRNSTSLRQAPLEVTKKLAFLKNFSWQNLTPVYIAPNFKNIEKLNLLVEKKSMQRSKGFTSEDKTLLCFAGGYFFIQK